MLVTLVASLTLGVSGEWAETASTRGGVVVCDEPLAAEAGAKIFRRGGNAVDAAVAVAFALAVVEPSAGNIGGGGFMLVRTADGRSAFLDYREKAPHHASRNMYLAPDGNVRPQASTVGPLASGVPGTVAGMDEARRRFGRLPWKDLLQPACDLAANGFRISTVQASALRSSRTRLSTFPETASQYFPAGHAYAPGEIVRLPHLAETLARIRDRGAQEFYRGVTAQRLCAHMARHGGIIDAQDLAEYRTAIRPPLRAQFWGHEIITAPPPSSGGIALVEMLNILACEETGRPLSVAMRIHEMTEAMKFAFADRSEFLGDPDFVEVPLAKLTSPAYGARLAAKISERDIPSADIKPGTYLDAEPRETTHFSVVDAAGNAVANTYTLNGSFGCGDSAEGDGFLLNNEMDDFAAKPGTPNMFGLIQGERNAVGAGRRPLSSMTPTIVVRNGRLEMVLGSPGGPTIINTVLEVFLNRAELGMSALDAVRAPRMHHQWMPDVLTAEALPVEVVKELRSRGHRVEVGGRQGTANCIFIEPGTRMRIGVADRRYPVAAAAVTGP